MATLSGTTKDKNGDALGSCDVFVFKRSGSTLTYVDHTTSNASTGAWSVTTADTDPAYLAYTFKDDSPHVFDVSGDTLKPV